MAIDISQQTEARLAEEAQRQGVSVDALIERLMNERIASFSSANRGVPANPTVFDQGLGLFSSPEDAALIDEVVSLVYAERRRPVREEPLAT